MPAYVPSTRNHWHPSLLVPRPSSLAHTPQNTTLPAPLLLPRSLLPYPLSKRMVDDMQGWLCLSCSSPRFSHSCAFLAPLSTKMVDGMHHLQGWSCLSWFTLVLASPLSAAPSNVWRCSSACQPHARPPLPQPSSAHKGPSALREASIVQA